MDSTGVLGNLEKSKRIPQDKYFLPSDELIWKAAIDIDDDLLEDRVMDIRMSLMPIRNKARHRRDYYICALENESVKGILRRAVDDPDITQIDYFWNLFEGDKKRLAELLGIGYYPCITLHRTIGEKKRVTTLLEARYLHWVIRCGYMQSLSDFD
ncbi:MAG: hypothetical protein Q7R96_03285 [Nanoarchaeota archaeon]|nr:hypothetical protein [Nanoarchaeota archaeon]